MKARKTGSVVFGLLLLSFSALGAEHPELKAFPPAKEGMDRFVIVLPHKDRGEDAIFKVEIIAGRDLPTDGVNLVRLGETIEPRDLEGWGYTYYEVAGAPTTLSTLMAPPKDAPMVKRWVTAEPLLIRYNSRLPIVVYAPRGYQIRYRIWSTSEDSSVAEQG